MKEARCKFCDDLRFMRQAHTLEGVRACTRLY